MARRKKHFFGVCVDGLGQVEANLDDAEPVGEFPGVVVFRHNVELAMDQRFVEALLALDHLFDRSEMKEFIGSIFQLGYRTALKDYPKIDRSLAAQLK